MAGWVEEICREVLEGACEGGKGLRAEDVHVAEGLENCSADVNS